MNERAYYNENDEFAAAWLKAVIAKGLIAPGDVDTRSIVDVRPSDLTGYRQCHFFAGIGVWSYALRSAGWPDDRHAWTGSCPCGPFSQAGKGEGFADERHLWPAFFHLIGECKPRIVFGEQVASPDGLAWLDLVQADMEDAGYAFAALDLCAAGFGAPHIRQRLYWVADSAGGRREYVEIRERGLTAEIRNDPLSEPRIDSAASGSWRSTGDDTRILVDGLGARLEGHAGHGDDQAGWPLPYRPIAPAGSTGELADADGGDTSAEGLQRSGQQRLLAQDGRVVALADTADRQFPIKVGGSQGRDGHGPDRANAPAGPVNGLWRDADWLLCRDGKWRPVEPGTFPLAHGAAARVGRLRGYGNAIVAQVAQAFIEAVMEAMP